MKRFLLLTCLGVLVLVASCVRPAAPVRPAPSVCVHILPSANHGCEIICKDGVCTIICPFEYGCRPDGEAVCVVDNGELRISMGCCPMYVARRSCGCLKDGIYNGYCKDRVCIFKIPIAK